MDSVVEATGWRRVALPVSLVINLFLIALIGGQLLHKRSDAEDTGAPFGRALARAESLLSPQGAAAFGAVMRREEPRYGSAARQLQEARLALNRQLSAGRYSASDTRRALTAWRTAWNRFMDGFSDPFVEALGQVSAEDRRKFVSGRRAARTWFY